MKAIPFSAGLLAGGASSRMGCEKARLPFGGGELWQFQIAQLEALQPAEIFISARAEQSFSNYRVVSDDVPAAGPLAGIAALLAAASTDWLLVLAVDMPFVPAEFFQTTLASKPRCGLIPETAHGYEPLAALYPKAAGPLAQKLLHSPNRALQNFARHLLTSELCRAQKMNPEQATMFRSLNSPQDLAREKGTVNPDRAVTGLRVV